jgi:hypothetical protein
VSPRPHEIDADTQPRSGTEPRWIRHRPDPKQNRTALAAGLGVGLGVGLVLGGTVFYLARLLLAREPIAPAPGGRRAPRAEEP